MTRMTRLASAAALAGLLAMSGCSSHDSTPAAQSPATSTASCRTLAQNSAWYGDNRDRIDAMLAKLGTCGAAGSVTKGAPLALFDWDNTIVKNDIGDATFFWMVRNGKLRAPADGNWASTSAFLTPPAVAALARACAAAKPGQPMPTDTDTACADELVSVYTDAKTKAGEPAFAGFNARRMEPAYAWAAQMQAGWREAEVVEFAKTARKENLDAPAGTEQKVGSSTQTGWVRYYPQMRDLVETLHANGFDVRIISASAEPVARVWAEELDIPADHVMGVRTEHDGDVLTSRLVPCGGEPAITYIEGKRCRVNEEVFGVTGPAAFTQQPEPKRAAFAAGDSDTDVTFLTDATALRLVLNRNKTELMCTAYDNAGGNWLVNPMFIDPKKQAEPYACATKGYIEPTGAKGPLHRPDGSVVPDQQDRVY
ncbi:haloacid dehalogenase-like hydrolase [Mycolicibacterium sp. 141076]|uniref:HAD family hydrolase n=2 Tax=Mycobacteriaceae TaxID=1762 RepID=UPI001CFBC208|nr:MULTISPECIES: haloacid dehalogenase-like hydrolase [Mycolicibacterium]MDX1881241.1 haloacid dehalogenase-like hydrolase [Mycolicibacterium sp. 141076]UCZ59490.1 haloacid dehalogenase-like hydrolase [Mycolicibacterium phocaicum]